MEEFLHQWRLVEYLVPGVVVIVGGGGRISNHQQTKQTGSCRNATIFTPNTFNKTHPSNLAWDSHRENGGTLGMVPVKFGPHIHPMYWVSLGSQSPYKGLQPGVLNSLGALHPKGTRIFPRRGRAWSSFMCFSTCSSSSLAWDCVFATDLEIATRLNFLCPVKCEVMITNSVKVQ